MVPAQHRTHARVRPGDEQHQLQHGAGTEPSSGAALALLTLLPVSHPGTCSSSTSHSTQPCDPLSVRPRTRGWCVPACCRLRAELTGGSGMGQDAQLCDGQRPDITHSHPRRGKAPLPTASGSLALAKPISKELRSSRGARRGQAGPEPPSSCLFPGQH